jgi:hypothetical protein
MPWKESRKTVCVDFDGVLNDYKGYVEGHTYPINKAGAEFLRKLKKTGFEVVVLTSARLGDVERVLHDACLDDVVDHITNVKVPAIAYIDDRAITFRGDFDQTFRELMNFKTWWEDENHTENHGLSEKSE